MITLKEAIDIALGRNPKFNAFQEYADAYEFFIDDGIIREGGEDNSCIIEKKNGTVLRWPAYFMDGKRTIVEIGEPRKIDDHGY